MFGIVRKGIAMVLVGGMAFMSTGCGSVEVTLNITVSPSGVTATEHYRLLLDPPGSDVANFDTTQGLLALTLSNATVTSTSGTFVLSIIDHPSQVTVGQQTFNYVVNGNSVFAQDPTAVHNWLQQFANYADVDVEVDVNPTVTAIAPGTVTTTGSALYQGTTYASATASWTYAGDTGGGTCQTRICPNQ